jgi:hypothetical protein
VTDQQRYEANLRAAEREHDQRTELDRQLNEATQRDAQAVIRIVLLLNGGAAIAVLAFAGSLASKASYTLPQLGGVIYNSIWFVLGAASSCPYPADPRAPPSERCGATEKSGRSGLTTPAELTGRLRSSCA